MARAGAFGAGLNPFGGGTLGGLSQYDIAADLADLEVYRVEVAWGNGLASNEEYVAALNKALAATDPETQRRESAQNKLDDALYRIGRSDADKKGLDDLIAFDQSSLAKMRPDNLRYRDIENSLKSELAQRRSRDYGELVVSYNAGKTSTENLLAWVKSAQKTVDADDPDFDNWQSTAADLTERLDSERDEKVYQDYQQGRMKPDAFLAYLTTRRDGYDPSSPKYDDWTNRLEDAKKQVTEQRQSAADQKFFNAYEEGKKSDKDYLGYIRKRLGGMEADDPDRASWQHRLNQASFSLAEDKLRFDVEKGKASVGRLVSFYRNYRATLNPGSAEWRQVTRSLDALAGFGGGGGAGGGGGRRSRGGGGGGGKKPAVGAGAALTPKAINISTIEGALALMEINPFSDPKAQKAAKAFFDLNYTSLENARQRGDDVFLFYDPRKPGGAIAAKNPDGTPALDKNGKPILVRGSAYLPVSDSVFSEFNVLRANYHYGLAELALNQHDSKKYASELRRGLDAQDKARLVDSQSIQHSFDRFYDQAQDGIEAALRVGDYALAVNLSNEMAKRLATELDTNPMLDDTRRARLEALGEKLSDNPLIPKVDPLSGRQIGGAADLASSSRDREGNFTNVALRQGWHHVLDNTDARGGPTWGLDYDDVQDGSWEASHVAVTTSYGKSVVKGEVTKRKAGTSPTVFVDIDEGMLRSALPAADFLSFTDENGQVVKSYSIDGGRTWLRSLSGTAPALEVAQNVHRSSDGKSLLRDSDGAPVFEAEGDGWKFVGDQSDVAWYGTNAARERGGFNHPVFGASAGPWAGGERLVGGSPQAFSFGAPGQQMQFVTAGSDGSVSFLSDRQMDAWEKELLGERGGFKKRTSHKGLPPGAVSTPVSRADERHFGAPPPPFVNVIAGGAKSVLNTTGLGWLTGLLEGVVIPGLGLGVKPGSPPTIKAKTPPPPVPRAGAPGAYRPPPLPTLKVATPPALSDERHGGILPPPPALKPLTPIKPKTPPRTPPLRRTRNRPPPAPKPIQRTAPTRKGGV